METSKERMDSYFCTTKTNNARLIFCSHLMTHRVHVDLTTPTYLAILSIYTRPPCLFHYEPLILSSLSLIHLSNSPLSLTLNPHLKGFGSVVSPVGIALHSNASRIG